jgi:hypothetical protein
MRLLLWCEAAVMMAIFGVKILKFFDLDPGSGIETIRIRDRGLKKVGSGIKKNPGSATLVQSVLCLVQWGC